MKGMQSMSTVQSINFYFDLKGISEDVTLVQDSQDVDLVKGYVSEDVIADYGSFFVFARNGEVLNIWGISAYIPWNDSYVEMIYSAAKYHRDLMKKNAKLQAVRAKTAQTDKHWIAMAGLRGYMPNYCESCESYDSAVESLADLHELSDEQTEELRANSWLDLDIHEQGNEYCEISECDCGHPEDHSSD